MNSLVSYKSLHLWKNSTEWNSTVSPREHIKRRITEAFFSAAVQELFPSLDIIFYFCFGLDCQTSLHVHWSGGFILWSYSQEKFFYCLWQVWKWPLLISFLSSHSLSISGWSAACFLTHPSRYSAALPYLLFHQPISESCKKYIQYHPSDFFCFPEISAEMYCHSALM